MEEASTEAEAQVDSEGKYSMKKTAITILFALAAVVGHAQTANDAYMFSENHYEGSARTVAMGNAFTALGGDPGSININPAGSAVSKFGQMTITPSLTFATNTAQGVSPYADGNLTYFQDRITTKTSTFGLPNIGLTYNWDSGRKSGLKTVSFGFVCNQTNSWNGEVFATGTNSNTSFMGAVANTASLNGYLGSELDADDAYDFMPWREVSAFKSGMISTFGGMDDNFVGASEAISEDPETGTYNIYLAGPLRQTFDRNVNGYKRDYVFNLGANISDFIYVGANLGLTSIIYYEDWYLMEQAVNQNDFEIGLDNGETIYFQQMKYNYNYIAEGSGVYGKFGIIVTPGNGLRIGAAIQTPTVTTMDETWTEYGETQFSSGKYSSLSPYGSAQYSFRSPMRSNFGIAYTYGSLGLISVDYEMADYSTMKYDTTNADRDYFTAVNEDIQKRFGISHMLRAGIEVKPLPALAVRAGYSLTTSAEMRDSWSNRLDPQKTQTASFGLGYSSKGPFFADAAIQTRFLSNEYFMPYEDYIDQDGNILEYAPEIVNNRSLWKAVITFGWRF